MAYATSTTKPPARVRPRPGRVAAPHAGRGRFGARRRAFTLVEALMASVVLAIAVVGIGSSLTTTVHQSAVVEQDETAALLARQLMEEIAAKPFLDPDTGTVSSRESSRSLYDNVDDYNGYTDTIDASHPASSLQGKTVAVTNGRKYTRTVSVTYHATPNGPNVPSGDFALILVAVTSPSGHVTQLWRMATNTTLIQK